MNTPTRPCRHCRGTAVERDEFATGQALRAARQKAGLNLKQVATVMRVDESYLSMLELGRRDWTDAMIARFEKAIAV